MGYLTKKEDQKAIGDCLSDLRTMSSMMRLESMAKELDAQIAREARRGKASSNAPAPSYVSDHIDNLRKTADRAEKAAARHAESVRSIADDLEDSIQGSEQLYAGVGSAAPGQQEGAGKHRFGPRISGEYSVKSAALNTRYTAHELKALLPASVRQRFWDEYNRTGY